MDKEKDSIGNNISRDKDVERAAAQIRAAFDGTRINDGLVKKVQDEERRSAGSSERRGTLSGGKGNTQHRSTGSTGNGKTAGKVRVSDNAVREQKLKTLSQRIFRYAALLVLFFVLFFVAFDFSYKYALKTESELAVLDQTDGMLVKDGVEVEIPYGADTKKVANILYEGDFITNKFVFRLLSKINGYDSQYQAGMHIISNKMNYTELMYVLSSSPETVTVMIPEGFSIAQIAQRLSENNVIDTETFYKALDEEEFTYKFLENIPEGKDFALEGYLFPDTYYFNVSSRPRDVLLKFLENFESKFKNTYYSQAEELGLTVDELLTLASIVEKESGSIQDRRIIAGIMYKRLKTESASLKFLQSCATIQYIYLRDTGAVTEQVTYADTEIDDPYNTYKYAGLPPGPICNPSKDAILAVLDMDKNTPYWYFCATGNGGTCFSKTYDEHVQAVNKYQYIVE